MLLVAMAYYLWAVGSDLSGLRLAVGLVDVQSFPASSRIHQFGAVSVSGAVPCLFVATEKPQLLKASIVVTNFGIIPGFQHHFVSQNQRNP